MCALPRPPGPRRFRALCPRCPRSQMRYDRVGRAPLRSSGLWFAIIDTFGIPEYIWVCSDLRHIGWPWACSVTLASKGGVHDGAVGYRTTRGQPVGEAIDPG